MISPRCGRVQTSGVRHERVCIKMAERQNGTEKTGELDSIDLKSLDLKNSDDQEVTLGTHIKGKEKAVPDGPGAPPTFGQGIRQSGDSRSERQRIEQPRPILKKRTQSMVPDTDTSSWQFVEDHSQKDIMSCRICLDVLVAPHLITCCGECVCKKCIDSHLQRETAIREDKKPLCPFCRKAEFRLIENLGLKKTIGKLKVYCLYRKSGCMWSGKLQEGKAHLQECVFCPITCPNGCRECGKIERRNLSKHIAECPMQVVECSFEHIGCKMKHPLLRKEAQVHSNKGIHHHLVLLARSSIRLYEECDITHATLRSSHDEMVKEKTARISSQKQELALLEQIIESLEVNLFGLKQKINTLKETEDANRAKYTAQLNAKSKEARGLQDICQVTLAEVQALPMPQATSVLYPPVIFAIDSFNFRKILDEEWISPPFYTHYGGYKMCLMVHPNGYKEVRGSHVSIYIHMMSGEFDDHLQWPFPGAIVNVSALSQRNAIVGGMVGSRGNYGAAIVLSGQRTLQMRSRVYNGTYGPGYGQQQYIPHRILNQYLAGDVFKIVIYHIQFLPL